MLNSLLNFSNFRTNLSLSAFLALNGTLSTDTNGSRFLVNSKGDDVQSTSGGACKATGNNKIDTTVSLRNWQSYTLLGEFSTDDLTSTNFDGIMANYYRSNSMGHRGADLFYWVRTNSSNTFKKIFVDAVESNKPYRLALVVRNMESIKFFVNGILFDFQDITGYPTTELTDKPFDIFGGGVGDKFASNIQGRDVFIIDKAIADSDVDIYMNDAETFFRHCNNEVGFVDTRLSFNKSNVLLNMPLNEIGAVRHDYATSTDYTVTNYTATCDVQGLSTGLQQIAFDDSVVYTAEQMNFYNGDTPQYVQDLVVGQPLSIKETMKNGAVYLWTYDGTTKKLYKDGLTQTNATITEVNIGQISRLNGELESEIDTFELFNKVIKPNKYYKWVTSNDGFIIASNDGYILTTERN